jgi:hypothetical protein
MASRFTYGEDVHFEYLVGNRTGSDLSWSQSFGYPPVAFSVSRDTWGVGSTLLGQGAPQEITGVLRDGGVLAYRSSWLSNPSSMVLPPGKYRAWALFTYDFANYEEPEQRWLEFEVEAPDPGEQHVFSLRSVTGYFGIFCLREGSLYSSTILKTRRGTYELFASVLVQSNDSETPCLPEGATDHCLQQEQLDPIELTPTQATTLEGLIAAFPAVTPEIDFACDPCASIEYYMNDRLYELSPCAVGPPEYVEHAGDLASFVRRTVFGGTQTTMDASLGSRRTDRERPFE